MLVFWRRPRSAGLILRRISATLPEVAAACCALALGGLEANTCLSVFITAAGEDWLSLWLSAVALAVCSHCSDPQGCCCCSALSSEQTTEEHHCHLNSYDHNAASVRKRCSHRNTDKTTTQKHAITLTELILLHSDYFYFANTSVLLLKPDFDLWWSNFTLRFCYFKITSATTGPDFE